MPNFRHFSCLAIADEGDCGVIDKNVDRARGAHHRLDTLGDGVVICDITLVNEEPRTSLMGHPFQCSVQVWLPMSRGGVSPRSPKTIAKGGRATREEREAIEDEARGFDSAGNAKWRLINSSPSSAQCSHSNEHATLQHIDTREQSRPRLDGGHRDNCSGDSSGLIPSCLDVSEQTFEN